MASDSSWWTANWWRRKWAPSPIGWRTSFRFLSPNSSGGTGWDGPKGGVIFHWAPGSHWERDTLARQVERLGLERCVRFLGAVDPDAVAGLYRSALLVACPSRWEGLPLACLEAMASARAVVATAVGGIPDVVTHGETGVLVPPGDVPALAAAIRALADDATERRRLGRQARAHVAEAYAWPTIARRHLDVLAEAVRERNGAA